MKLRDYQNDAANAACQAWDGGADRVLLVLATGLGKTIIFATLAKLWLAQDRGRVLVIAPSIELVDQAAQKIERVTGETPAIEQAANWSNEDPAVRSSVVVSCKASLVSKMPDGRRRFERLRDIGLIVIDEAHYAATQDYVDICEHFDCKALGVTATPKRHDGVRLGELFDSAPYTMGIQEGVELGWLSPPRLRCLQLASLDLTRVKTNRGDFTGSSLGAAMEDDKVVYEVAEAIAQELRGDKTLGFTASVDQAMKVAGVLCDTHGVRAEWVCGDKSRCPDAKRREILDSFRNDAGGVQVVMNCGVLTTGFDFPGLKHIVNARPTKSRTLFTQMFGRGTRTLDGVVDALAESSPDARRAAIAASGKPHWRWTDLRDTAMQHELVTPIDVLGGTLSIQEREQALELAKAEASDRDVGELIREAAEAVRAREEAERRRLAQKKANAQFSAVDIDPFVSAFSVTHDAPAKKERGPRMPYGKHKGQLLRDVPASYLAFIRREHNPTGWLGEAINKQLGVLEVTTA